MEKALCYVLESTKKYERDMKDLCVKKKFSKIKKIKVQ